MALTLALGWLVPLNLGGGGDFWGRETALAMARDSLLSHLWVWGLMAGVWSFSGRIPAIGAVGMRGLVAIGLLGYLADIAVGTAFQVRFFLRDAIAFGGDPVTWLHFLTAGLAARPAFVGGAILLLVWGLAGLPAVVFRGPRRSGRWAGPICGLAVAVGLGSLPHSGRWRTRVGSVWELALTDTSSRPYSPAFRHQVARQGAPMAASLNSVRQNPAPRRPDIILLIIESWSAYQSARFGGEDWTPRLDGLAARGWAFTNFHANGILTEDGIISMIAGEEPIMPAGGVRRGWLECFAGFMGADRALPRLLAPAGYRSCWLTTGPIRFSCKHQFLDLAGFDLLSDGSDPFYGRGEDGVPWPIGAFGPPDRALYLRALDLLDAIDRGRERTGATRPWLLVLETTSSHLPLHNPDGPPHDEAPVMAYADREAAAFVGGLRGRGFFRDGGLLIVTADHRSMGPVTDRERRRLGPSAGWRIPMFFLADWLPSGIKDGRLAAQTDLAPTLEWLTTGRTPVAGRRCVLLDPGSPPARFFAARMQDARHLIHATDTLNGASGTIRLAGDRSSSDGGLEEALLWITWERMAREPRTTVIPDVRAPLRHARMITPESLDAIPSGSASP
ncbi:MAG: sulfatase-like hydrolase/transferase [Verrucomicrobiae bacterium]|nr:sulfatase-like hydrolase/transferase [Verrucomicrobiae bacterium]